MVSAEALSSRGMAASLTLPSLDRSLPISVPFQKVNGILSHLTDHSTCVSVTVWGMLVSITSSDSPVHDISPSMLVHSKVAPAGSSHLASPLSGLLRNTPGALALTSRKVNGSVG